MMTPNHPADMNAPVGGTHHIESEALRLVALGYHVHPIIRKGYRYRDRHGVEHVTNGKAPILRGWQIRSLTQADLLVHLADPNVSGIGFRAGEHIAVLDLDGEGHRGVYEYLVMELTKLAWAPIVRTGSAKEHLHFSCPGMPEVFTSQKFPRPDLRSVVELRGHRSNCVLPPTTHPDTGERYRWVRDPEDYEFPVIPFATIRGWLANWAGIPAIPASRQFSEVRAKTGTRNLPVGHFAMDFVMKGWPLGCPEGISQRHAVLRTTRNLLSAGWSTDQVLNAVWVGIQKSPWDHTKGPWMEEEIHAIVEDLARRPAPQLKQFRTCDVEALGPITELPGGLHVQRVAAPLRHIRTARAKELVQWLR